MTEGDIAAISRHGCWGSALSVHISTENTGRGRKWGLGPGLKFPSSDLRNIIPSGRPHLLRFPKPPKTSTTDWEPKV